MVIKRILNVCQENDLWPTHSSSSSALSLHLEPTLALLSTDPPAVGAAVCRPRTHPHPLSGLRPSFPQLLRVLATHSRQPSPFLETTLSWGARWSRQGSKCLVPLPQSGPASGPSQLHWTVVSVEASDGTESQLIFSCRLILLPRVDSKSTSP